MYMYVRIKATCILPPKSLIMLIFNWLEESSSLPGFGLVMQGASQLRGWLGEGLGCVVGGNCGAPLKNQILLILVHF